jgi:deoxyribonuclease V
VSPEEAVAMQARAAEAVVLKPLGAFATIAGVDVCYRDDSAVAAAVLCDEAGNVMETAMSDVHRATFPYVPGLLWFREGELYIEAIRRLSRSPDVLLVDGNGILHPRLCGAASSLGLVLNLPSIGCAKTPGDFDWSEPGDKRGDWTPVSQDERVIGATLRTRDGTKPVWVSAGHLCELKDAIEIVLKLSHFRIPDPLRHADAAGRLAMRV